MRFAALTALAVTLLAAACARSAPGADLRAEETAIKELDARWLKAVQAHDAAGEAALFAEDGVAYREHVDPLVGPAAYQTYITKINAENPKVSTSWRTDSIRIAESGELAVQTGAFQSTGLGANGDGEDRGRFVTVWKKTGGTWKVAYDISSTTMPDLAADAIIGSWALDVAKSRFTPGPPPRSESRSYVLAGREIKASSKTVDAAGKATTSEWTVNYDSKERPIVGDPDVDTLSLKRVDAFTTEFTEKRAGKVAITGTRAISPDGKTMTITTKGSDAKGRTIDSVLVFQKQ